MLTDLVSQKEHICFIACATQTCLVLLFGGLECLLLAVMAYDRYVAICNPLHYCLIMSPQVCVQMVTASWVSGVPVVIGQTWQVFSLPFCGSTKLIIFSVTSPQYSSLLVGTHL